MSTYWKFLLPGATSPFFGFRWPTVGRAWVEGGAGSPCREGIHACRSQDLAYWLLPELWRIELDEVEPVGDIDLRKVVARRARLVDRVGLWSPDTEREMALACIGRTARHAAAELSDVGDAAGAEALAAVGDLHDDGGCAALADAASVASGRAFAAGHEGAGRLAAYVADSVEYLDGCPVATIAFIAARAADERSAVEQERDGFEVERAWQCEWMVERLGFDVSADSIVGSLG